MLFSWAAAVELYWTKVIDKFIIGSDVKKTKNTMGRFRMGQPLPPATGHSDGCRHTADYPAYLCSMQFWSEGLLWPSAPCLVYPEEINFLKLWNSQSLNHFWDQAWCWALGAHCMSSEQNRQDLGKLRISLIFQTWWRRREGHLVQCFSENWDTCNLILKSWCLQLKRI